MNNISISHKAIVDKLNLEAIRFAPDGNLLAGYQILNNKKILYKHDKNLEIYIIPHLINELTLDLEIIVNGSKRLINNMRQDVSFNL